MMTTGCGEYYLPTYMQAARRRCDDEMRHFLKRVNFDGVRVDRLSVAGYCPAAIYEAAAKEDVDLIIISTHGRTGLGRALIGSVAEGTVRHAACPVLVVPSSAGMRESAPSKNASSQALRSNANKSSARSL
jgi:universal stress protein family protein